VYIPATAMVPPQPPFGTIEGVQLDLRIMYSVTEPGLNKACQGLFRIARPVFNR
jgi:hypothetical protein